MLFGHVPVEVGECLAATRALAALDPVHHTGLGGLLAPAAALGGVRPVIGGNLALALPISLPFGFV